MKSLVTIFILLLVQSLPAATPPADPFRVTGIITIGERNVALIELPDGTQEQLRAGDAFAGGKVLEVTPTAMRVGFEDVEEQTFTLQGADVRPGLPEQSYVNSPEPPVTEQHQQVLQREVVDGRLEEALGQITADLQKNAARKVDSAPSREDQAAETTTELTRLLSPLVNLPGDTRVVGIDHAPVTSAREGIEQIRKALVEGNVVRLNIESKSGEEQRIYLMPDRSVK
jgi:hypothetical protein